MIWLVEMAEWGSTKLDLLLNDGWEPFAVVGDDVGTTVFLRRTATLTLDQRPERPT
jgi:hypothetical protein